MLPNFLFSEQDDNKLPIGPQERNHFYDQLLTQDIRGLDERFAIWRL
jgi:hypothetical protein